MTLLYLKMKIIITVYTFNNVPQCTHYVKCGYTGVRCHEFKTSEHADMRSYKKINR